MKGSYYNVIFYDVETQEINSEKLIKYETYLSIEEADEYIKNTIEMKCLDYNEKLVLIKREYDVNREIIDEEIIKEYNCKGEIKC